MEDKLLARSAAHRVATHVLFEETHPDSPPLELEIRWGRQEPSRPFDGQVDPVWFVTLLDSLVESARTEGKDTDTLVKFAPVPESCRNAVVMSADQLPWLLTEDMAYDLGGAIVPLEYPISITDFCKRECCGHWTYWHHRQQSTTSIHADRPPTLPAGKTRARAQGRHTKHEFKTRILDAPLSTREDHQTRLSLSFEIPALRTHLELMPVTPSAQLGHSSCHEERFLDLSRPQHIRAKMRLSFLEMFRCESSDSHDTMMTRLLNHSHSTQWRPLWRIDLTMSWNGLDAASVHASRLDGQTPPRYEVEIECVDLQFLWHRVANNDAGSLYTAIDEARERVESRVRLFASASQ